jgi:hypothetical protein
LKGNRQTGNHQQGECAIMDAIREQLNKPLVVGAIGLVLGLLLGVLYGWVINPVEWTDADISHLREDLQEDYLRMAIDSYAYNGDAALATQRYAELGEGADEVLAAVVADSGNVRPEDITAFTVAVGASTPLIPGVTAEPGEEQPTAGGGFTRILLPLLCVVVLVLAAGLAFLYFFRGRGQRAPGSGAARAPARQEEQAEWTDYSSMGEEPPMVQFMASYKLGDDLFDDSFSIDSPVGEFLGECGVGISETIGVGEPKRVSAFEVWLFDKNDIQTVTKVLMSAHAFLDESARQRLAAKGEPVLAEPGTEAVLETQTLRLVARVVDMGYGEGALPEQSYLDRLILELAVWQKM